MSGNSRWRVPREEGAVLAEPPLARVGEVLAENRRRLATGPTLLDRSLTELRDRAGREILAAATQYLKDAGEPIPSISSSSLVLAGHQPELFHPGVWAKNFALQGIARAHGRTALNLVVDNDTAKSTGLRLPARAAISSGEAECGSSIGWRVEPFDRWTGEVPYEELRVRDESLFASFAVRAGEILAGWGFPSLLPTFWDEACRQASRTAFLGERFAAARRGLERRWGCHNLEVPVSVLCGTESFAWFACHLLAHLADFHALYNASVRDYRQRFRVRSRNHPVPDLGVEGDWLEAPFWGWRSGQTRRGRVFARCKDRQIVVRVGDEEWTVSSPADWPRLEQRGLKVRSRALTTTLFARLFLGELFLHGIGGAKYDALTDDLIRRFYRLEPPAFVTLSATLYLPLPAFPTSREQHEKLRSQSRDMEYNPQRHLAAPLPPDVSRWVHEKEQWIARSPATSAERKERFRVLRSLNERLRPLLSEQERSLRRELACKRRQLEANAILQRRDYAFCLFPEEKLRSFAERFLRLEE